MGSSKLYENWAMWGMDGGETGVIGEMEEPLECEWECV